MTESQWGVIVREAVKAEGHAPRPFSPARVIEPVTSPNFKLAKGQLNVLRDISKYDGWVHCTIVHTKRGASHVKSIARILSDLRLINRTTDHKPKIRGYSYQITEAGKSLVRRLT